LNEKELVAVIFGGTGFIGSFFACHLIESEGFKKVYVFDYHQIHEKKLSFRTKLIKQYPEIQIIYGDVRNPIDWIPNEKIGLIANFAAIHREPGHEIYEYFDCNLKGAYNVCNFADKVGCKKMIFSSSISPYGPSEELKDESSLPVPATAYGSSKLVAEKIHEIWQSQIPHQKQLVIVRPGVVFGPGEGGNVSRLIKALKKRYFFYTGNKKTRKAGVYVKELCNAMTWVLKKESSSDKVTTFNMSMNPGPSIEDYVKGISEIQGVNNFIPSVPEFFLLAASYIIELFAKPFGIEHPFSPLRIKKLNRSNNISPKYLEDNGYKYLYTLKSALEDWKKDCPEDWI
tara:strand:- start:10230 stop:11258 length:1029 start_codon:yes stop_codon:yes gene_type:complete